MKKVEKYGLDRCNLKDEYLNAPMGYIEFKDLIKNSASNGFKILDAGAGEGKDKKLFLGKNVDYKGIDSGVGHKSWDYSDVIDADLENLDKPEGNPERCLNFSKATKLLGYNPKWTLEDGLLKTIEWYNERY